MWLGIILGITGLIALIYISKGWGASQEKRKQAEKIAKERSDDAKIGNRPFVDNPFGRMRKKD